MSLGPGIPARLLLPRPTPSIDIGFRWVTECVAKPCWVDCITSTSMRRPVPVKCFCSTCP
jgi:hypothetical protein